MLKETRLLQLAKKLYSLPWPVQGGLSRHEHYTKIVIQTCKELNIPSNKLVKILWRLTNQQPISCIWTLTIENKFKRAIKNALC